MSDNEQPKDDDTAKVPILGHQIDRNVTPEEDETQKNRIQLEVPAKWKCPWCELTVFDSVDTGCELESRSCYKCGAIGIIGSVGETDDIIDTAMAVSGIDQETIKQHQADRVHGLGEVGLVMKSGYLEMEEQSGAGTQGLWFRSSSTES